MSVVGIITTVKRRQEFRIRLQRRARRRVEKLLESAEDERQRQIVCICHSRLTLYLLSDLATQAVLAPVVLLALCISIQADSG